MHTITIIALGLVALTLAARKVVDISATSEEILSDIQEQQDLELVKCSAQGKPGSGADKMTVSWGAPKKQCVKLCGPTRDEGATYDIEFAQAFDVRFGSHGCECSAGDRLILRFKPRNLKQAQECKDGTSGECWSIYTKARGIYFEEVLKNPRYKTPYTPSDFVVNRADCKDECTGDDCKEMKLPGVIDGMKKNDKKVIGEASKKIMDGDKKKVSKILVELIEHLPPQDLDDSEFQAIDTDNDGHLSEDELIKFYTKFDVPQIKGFIKVADDDNNGTIEKKEFDAFKEAMRNFNPEVDLITGDKEFVTDDKGEIQKVKAAYKVTKVECMKNGHPVPEDECEGTQKDAIQHFEEDC